MIIITSWLILPHTDSFDAVKSKTESRVENNTALEIDRKYIVEKTEEIPDKNKTSNSMINVHKMQIDFEQTKLSGIAYSPYRKNQSPFTDTHPSLEDIENDIKLLSSVTNKIRIYGIIGNNQFIPEIAQKYGLKTAVTLLLTGDKTDYDIIEKAVQMANKHSGIYTIIVENEGSYKKDLNEEQIIRYLDKTREKLDPRCTITIAEPVRNWLEHPEIVKHVDYVMIHHYPYFNGFDVAYAANKVFDEYKNVKKLLGKDVVIGETNWPSNGSSIKMAIPSPENQQKFISEFRRIADFNEIEYFIFEAFDEQWKIGERSDPDKPNDVENYWGIFFENGTIKESLRDTIPSTPNITTRN